MTKLRCASICFMTLLVYGCGNTTSTTGSAETSSKPPEVPVATIEEKDSCTKPFVQIGILKVGRQELGTLLRGTFGSAYFKDYNRDGGNKQAIEVLNIQPSNIEPIANGYDRFDYFILDTLTTAQENSVTGVYKCDFAIRVLGTEKKPRSIEVVVGEDDLTATKEQFDLPKEDIVLRGSVIIDRATVERYEEEGENAYLNDDGKLEQNSFYDLLKRLSWSSVSLGKLGSVIIEQVSNDYVSRAELATGSLSQAPISSQWAALYRFRNGAKTPAAEEAKSDASDGETARNASQTADTAESVSEPTYEEMFQQCMKQKMLEQEAAGLGTNENMREVLENECHSALEE